jgi:hypothetical protein
LQWDAACGGSIVGKNTRFRFHALENPHRQPPGVADENTETTYCNAICSWAKVALIRISSICKQGECR